jgi:hypothetical protein
MGGLGTNFVSKPLFFLRYTNYHTNIFNAIQPIKKAK